MHAIHMQIWDIVAVKETVRLWQDVYAELQEEDVLLYAMKVEETNKLCAMCDDLLEFSNDEDESTEED